MHRTSAPSRDDTSVASFTAKVQEATGTSWEVIATGFDESEVCEQHAYWNASPACAAADPLEACDEAHVIDLDCSAPDVLGECKDFTGVREPEIWTYRTVTCARAGRYGLSITAQWDEESVGYIDLKSCGGGCGSFLRRFSVPTGPAVAQFFDIEEPGEYLLKIARPLAAPSPIECGLLDVCG